ncbi:MAG: Fe-S cluster assembly ATPase SufC [Acholeplasmatales bacterium]|jgi:Fe-S cluster assembly ATP-binding protein|nr:Fe-S cluster assembly ATPase SufC [Acholeplasmatales bacterium]
MNLLSLKNISVSIDNQNIIKSLNLEVKEQEVHVILGPNGAGKSSLCQAIMGNPTFTLEGDVLLNGQDITQLSPDEKSKQGLFLAFQNPLEFEGLVISEYLKTAMNAHGEGGNFISFAYKLTKRLRELELDDADAFKYLNSGFSGGQKKKLEILQLKMLKPKFAFLDEIDSGLDVDALRIVCNNVLEEITNNHLGLVIITHYNKILEYIKPTHVHLLYNKNIVLSGGIELIQKVQKEGYEWLKNI